MSKTIKRIIIIALFVLIAGATALISYLSEKTYFNDESVVGNTAGNLLNGGRFCEDEEEKLIYFSNPNDKGALYSMDLNCNHFKKIHSDNVSYINTAGKYIIYVRDNHKRNKSAGNFFSFNNVGIYRVNRNGERPKSLYSDPAKLTALKGNYVYYQHYNPDDGLKFYRIKIDGTEEQKISDDPIIPSSFSGNYLYYNGENTDHNIYVMDTHSTTSNLLYEGNCYNPVATKDYIYFLSLENNYALARIKKDGTDFELITNERVSFFNISKDEKYMYYQVDGGDNNCFCKIDLDTLESKILSEGDYNNIYVTSNYVFFQEFDSKKIYRLSISSDSISAFNPPVIEEK